MTLTGHIPYSNVWLNGQKCDLHSRVTTAAAAAVVHLLYRSARASSMKMLQNLIGSWIP